MKGSDKLNEAELKLAVMEFYGISEQRYDELIRNATLTWDKLMEDLSKEWSILSEPQEPTIDQLKKQIKYSKNPLEVKMLNKKLNQMYKDMKRR